MWSFLFFLFVLVSDSALLKSCDESVPHVPLFEVTLVANDAEVYMDPTPSEIESSLMHVLDDMVGGIRSLLTIDGPLMALLHLPERVIFRIGVRDEIYADMDRMLAQVCQLFTQSHSLFAPLPIF